MNAVRSNSSRPLTGTTRESVQVAPASTANLAAGDGAAAAPAAAGAQPQIEPGRASGRICVKPKLRKIEADTVESSPETDCDFVNPSIRMIVHSSVFLHPVHAGTE